MLNTTSSISINLIPMKGTNTPPNPYRVKFLVSNLVALIGTYLTPFIAKGISNGMMMALNIKADNTALWGVANPIMFRAFI